MAFLSKILGRRRGAPQQSGIFADTAESSAAQAGPAAPKRDWFGALKFRRKATVRPSSVAAAPVDLIQDQNGNVVYAFGLKWRTLVKAGGRDAAIDLARKAKATDFIYRSHQIGYGIFPKEMPQYVYPAAALAAKFFAGHALFALELDQGSYWLCLVKNSAIAGLDEVLKTSSTAEVAERIRALVKQVQTDALTVFTDLGNIGVANTRQFTIHDLLDVAKVDADRIHRLGGAGSRIPKPVLIATLVAGAVLAGKQGYNYYEAEQAAAARRAATPVDDSPEVAWAPVWANFLATTVLPQKNGLTEVRQRIGAMPAFWLGWRLAGARCEAGAVNEKKQVAWGCQATYDRLPIGEVSPKMGDVVRALFPDATVSFPTITSMIVTWPVVQTVATIGKADLKPKKQLVLSYYGEIQKFLPVFATPPDMVMTAFELPAPKKRDGSSQPKPASIPNLYAADVVFKGPLRSMDRVLAEIAPMNWKTFGMVIDSKSGPDQKNIKSSSFTVEMTAKVLSTD